MEKELKEEILKMIRHIDHWCKKAYDYTNDVSVKRCIENADNGSVRIKELLKD